VYRTFYGLILTGASLALPLSCLAASEYISFHQSPSGNALASIHGDVLYCDGTIGWGFIGNPQVISSQTSIAIGSVAAGGDCAPSNPPYPPPTPYQVAADLGMLSDGHYSVIWTYTLPPIVEPVMTASATLWVEGGEVEIFRGSFE
jgi:hypothetical protein